MKRLCFYDYEPGHSLTPWGSHGHLSRPIWDEPDVNDACWYWDPRGGRCCKFCDVWKEMPYVNEILAELSLYDPYRFAHISELCETIHGHYRMGWDRDGSESYFLSRDMDKLSKLLHKLYRHTPWIEGDFDDFASRLRLMGRELHVGPKRQHYYSLPRSRDLYDIRRRRRGLYTDRYPHWFGPFP
ncbi:hypothetical protein EK21DRAFT_85313 [Setomelanomma holmii]|uniref:Uncharacterized protein n=1 Tax=Setomelanomma holmii TaxID=210430 RepID=A0A9P4HGG9_9PLEO|nr:hypothetical protein EK21DRAFT_85313 [Setomelanomma holmii]